MKVSKILVSVILLSLFAVAVPCYINKAICERDGAYQKAFESISGMFGGNLAIIIALVVVAVVGLEYVMKKEDE